MGKSTAAERFRQRGIAVCDADAEVHRLYEGPMAAEIEAFLKTGIDGLFSDNQREAVPAVRTTPARWEAGRRGAGGRAGPAQSQASMRSR